MAQALLQGSEKPGTSWGRRNREVETTKLEQDQTVRAICSQVVNNKPLSLRANG